MAGIEKKIEAVIFDVDGLLIDSEPLWSRAQIDIFQGYGFDYDESDTLLTVGIRIDQVVAYWFEERGWKGPTIEQVTRDIIDRMIMLINEQGVPMEGALQTVDFFQQRDIRIAVASSSPHNIIDANISALGLEGCFEEICSAEHERYGKPHPAVYISTADKLGVDRRKCLVFEDSIAGILAAKAAQMTCVAVPDKAHLGDKRLGIADFVLRSLAEFDEIIWGAVNR